MIGKTGLKSLVRRAGNAAGGESDGVAKAAALDGLMHSVALRAFGCGPRDW